MHSIGGISEKEVMNFQVKILIGSQYQRIMKATEEKEIIIACLRMAWNDAFRHVSANVYNTSDDSKDANKEAVCGIYSESDIDKARKKANHELGLDQDNKDDALIVSEYICQRILGDKIVFETFLEYAQKTTTEDKVKVITDAISKTTIREVFSKVKKINDDKYPLCFGHFQKLFNMALKLYLCLYMVKDKTDITAPMGKLITQEMLENADCPIDSIILKQIDEKIETTPCSQIQRVFPYTKEKQYGNKPTRNIPFAKFEEIKWSKIGKFDVVSKDSGTTEITFLVEHYVIIQTVIREYMKIKHEGKSNLYFDFVNWN